MKYIRIYIATVLVVVCNFSVLMAQSDYFEQFVEPIETQLSESLDNSYSLKKVYEINEFEGTTQLTTYPLDDPYNTLKNYVLFAAQGDGPYWIFGLYKNGTVVWHVSETLECSDIKVYGSMDLNLDDRVDIMVNCALFTRPNFIGYMYIYSWNGSEAELISHIAEDQSAVRLSTIVSYEADSFGVLDLNGDGIMEIKGLDRDDSDQWNYWSWNGNKYGSWPSTPSPPDGSFYPADMAEGKVEVTVAKTDTGFVYHYTAHNSASSKRRVEEFYIDHGKPEKNGEAPNGWEFNGVGLSKYPFSWEYDNGNTKFMISPGDSLSGFDLYSNAPPGIFHYYIRSEHKLPDYTSTYSIEKDLNDIRTNSDKGITLAPGPDLDNLQQADSLRSYLNFSCGNGWVTNHGICNSLQAKLENVAKQLGKDKIKQAVNGLNAFLNEVSAQRGKHITEEGYGLLYFNGQYLLDRLSESAIGSGIACDCASPVIQSSGTINIQDGKTRCLSQEFTGSVFFQSGGTLNVCSTATLQNVYGNGPGQINISEIGDVTVGNWNNNYPEDGITNWGSLKLSGWTTVNQGSLINKGELTISGGLNQNSGAIVNEGTLDVSNDVNLNQPTENTGKWTIGGTLNLNSGTLSNSCRLEVAGNFLMNASYTVGSDSYTSVGEKLTMNSGTLALEGQKAMITAGSFTQNGNIASSGGANLLQVTGQITYNSGTLTTEGPPLQVCSLDRSAFPPDFNLADGCGMMIPPSSCNQEGFNANENN